jgi:hypothetical protein
MKINKLAAIVTPFLATSLLPANAETPVVRDSQATGYSEATVQGDGLFATDEDSFQTQATKKKKKKKSGGSH